MANHYQDLFHTPEEGRYFLTHSIGLMPVTTSSHLNDNYLDHWRSGSEDIWTHWLAGINEFNNALAALLNSSPTQFCPQSNVSSGLSKVIMALPTKSDKRVIVATESDFPSAGFVLKQAEKLGYQLKLIPKSEDLQNLDTWDRALTKDVHTAFITQVHYNTNTLTPVEAIAQICQTRNITTIVDTAQATGIVPIDLAKSNIDVVVGSCIKWLCGGPGAGFVWLNNSIVSQLEPYDVGWFSHKNPFEFDIHHFEYADSAARFWGGTPSVAAYITAANSIRLINKIGVKNIQHHNQILTQKLLSAVPESANVSPKDLSKKGGTTVLKFKNQAKIEANLIRHKIIFDARQYGFRFSPHIYTSDIDIDQLIDALS